MRHSRSRRRRPGGWLVRARVERFAEAAVLLSLREKPAHGYQLLDELTGLLPQERVDMGNLYRSLRALEEEGLVRSDWDDEPPGPAKRTYELTDSGRRLLEDWVTALRLTREQIDLFLDRYEERR